MQKVDLGLSGISELSKIGMVNPVFEGMQKVDLGLSGIPELSKIGPTYSDLAKMQEVDLGLSGVSELSKTGSNFINFNYEGQFGRLPFNELISAPKTNNPRQKVAIGPIIIRERDRDLGSHPNYRNINVNSEVDSIPNLLIECNYAAKLAGNDEIFKWTTKAVESLVNLLKLTPRDKRNFADLVDALYFIFYEGAGTDKLRYLTLNGGTLNDDECNFIWHLKNLRNKLLRHDPDRGKEGDIRRAWKELSETLQWLGIECYPTESNDFQYLHSNLLRETRAFLSLLCNSLTKERNT